MPAFALQDAFATENDGLVHVAYDVDSGWYRVFTKNHSYGGTAWLDESKKLADDIAARSGLKVKVHTTMRKR